MPDLDVSDVLDDPMFEDQCDVMRRPETLVDGRMQTGEVWFRKVSIVITQQDPATLMRREDGVTVPRRIFVASRFRFYGASQGYQPDAIHWNGTVYYVEEVLPYTRYGDGFVEVVASSQSQPDAPTR